MNLDELHKAIGAVSVNGHVPDCIEWVTSLGWVSATVRNDRVRFISVGDKTFRECVAQIFDWVKNGKDIDR